MRSSSPTHPSPHGASLPVCFWTGGQYSSRTKDQGSLTEKLRDLVDNVPEGVTTVTIRLDWLRAQLDREPYPATEAANKDTTYLSTREAARRLSVRPETVAAWCRKGRFPSAFKTDSTGQKGEWRIPLSEMENVGGGTETNRRIGFTRTREGGI